MKINRQDTNGVKPLLAVGELGYDNYPSGGDIGRVYVGTGSSNIAQAKKAEVVAVDGKVDTHVARNDNPHSVTKIQVGLSNVDNTADSTKVVASAGKWTTGRLINGTAVDGTVNITTSQWGTSRNITIGNTAKSVNGSADISWSLAEIGALGTASPAFTGVPTAPTASVGTNSTQIATTAYVDSQVANTAVKLTGNQTIADVKTFSSNIVGSITGNAGSATKLATARTINGVTFDGSANITVSDATAVKLTGDQTIAGVKTFTSSPVVPTPTTNTQAANKQYVDLKVALADFTGANASLTEIGYQKLPSGLILQWGKNASRITFNLPISFPNKKVVVIGIHSGNLVETIISDYLYNTSNSQHNFLDSYTNSVDVFWFAIGY